AVARDNTQRREAEAAHRESEERFRLLVDGVKDYAIIMLDPEGKIVSWNPGAERIKQYRAAEILGQHVHCFYTPEDIAQGQPDKSLKIAAQQGRVEEEGWRVRKDGSTFFANVVITALRGEDGQLRGFARVTRDITERKFAQETLKQTNDELEKRVAERTAELLQINQRLKQEIALHQQTEAALAAETHYVTDLLQKLQQTQTKLIHTEKMSSLGQVVAGVAHEINNPVSFIYGNIDYAICYLQDLVHLVELYGIHYPQPVADIQQQITDIDLDFLMADMPKLLASMKVGTNRIRQVVLSLQKFLKADQNEMKPADLHEGLESTLLILQHRLKPSVEHPEITVIKDYGTLPPVDCYAGQINQVFMNLLTNAVDVLEASGGDTPHQIKLSTEVQEINIKKPGASYCQNVPHAVIRIADNGPGMSQDVCQKLFEPFYTTKSGGKGTGLGLSISYQIIVEHHGGQLTCRSQPGIGSEFVIAIPITQITTRRPELSLAPS
ncbi:MAG: PAS domain S-box protein, partial [Coleofasciculus sp. C2-GNP5-27]